MSKCSFCDCQSVAELGRDYCRDHIGRYDSPIMNELLPSNNNELILKFFQDCFNTIEPRFSMVPLLYKRFPNIDRGVWISKQKKFSKSQEIYLSECFVSWLMEGGE